VVSELIDEIGFDAVDAGALGARGRLHRPGTAVYGADLTSEELRERARGLKPARLDRR
jgi:hypothetical protein